MDTYRENLPVPRWQVEEMPVIYNCMHNENYVEYQLRKYFGTTRPNDIMQKWNNDIKLYTGTDPVVKPAFVAGAPALVAWA